MSRIFWDTNLFIYLFEAYGELSKRTVELRSRMLARGDQLLTSALTVGELLVKPMEKGDTATALVLSFDVKAARTYASLRCDRSLRAPDIVQLACAASAGVDLFITNDSRLQEKQVDGIQFIVALDRAPI